MMSCAAPSSRRHIGSSLVARRRGHASAGVCALLTLLAAIATTTGPHAEAAIAAGRINPPVEEWRDRFAASAVAHDTGQDVTISIQQRAGVLLVDGRRGTQKSRIAVGAAQYHITPDGIAFVADPDRGMLRYDDGNYATPTAFPLESEPSAFLSHPPVYAARGNRLYVVTEQGVYVYDAGKPQEAGGDLIEHYPGSAFSGSLQAATAPATARESSGDGDVLIAASSDGKLYVLDPAQDLDPNRPLKSYGTGGGAWFPPVVWEHHAFVVINGNVVSAIDLTGDGARPAWQHPLPARATANVMVAQVGGVTYGYVPCGHLLHAFAITAQGATTAWEQDLQRRISYPAVLYPGVRPQVVVATSNVHGYDAATGAPAWTHNALMQSEGAMAEAFRETDINRSLNPSERQQIADCFPRITDPPAGPLTVSGQVIYAPLSSGLIHAFTPGYQVERGSSNPLTCSDLVKVRSLFWASQPEETFDTRPVVSGDRVWAASSKGNVFSAPTRRGHGPTTKEDVAGDPIVGLLETSAGDVCAVTSTGALHRRTDGSWTRSLSLYGRVATPPVGEENALVVVTADEDADLHVVDMAGGASAGAAEPIGATVRSMPGLAGGVLVFGDDLERIHVFQVAGGRARRVGRHIRAGAAVRGGAGNAPGGGPAYIGNEAGTVYAVRRNSTKDWDRTPIRAPIHRTPAVDARLVYVPYTTGTVVALQRNGGERRWEFPRLGPPVEALTPLLYGPDLLLVPYADGLIVALDRMTGTQRWNYQIAARLSADAVVHDGKLYAVTEDGELHALDPSEALTW
jgi:outer membrane protein assembly factor BamB